MKNDGRETTSSALQSGRARAVIGRAYHERVRPWLFLGAITLPVAGCEWPVRAGPALSPVTYARLVQARRDSANWLMYSGSYDGQRFSRLSQVDRENVADLRLQWVYPIDVGQAVETSPLVVDGRMYLTRPPNDVVALDAATGQQFSKSTAPIP